MFDGHGGREVAHFSRNHFRDCVKSEKAYADKDYKEGLRKAFLAIDDRLTKHGGLDEVAEMKRL